MRQRKIGNALVLFGLVVMALGAMTGQAFGHSDTGPNYQDKVVSISGSRSYDGTNTTFVFSAQFSAQVSHIVVASCPEGINVVDASGPDGVKVEKNKFDPGGTDHTGAKFEPGKTGTYSVTFSGNVTGAEFIVKNGNGHKHYKIGSGCTATSEVSTSSSSSSSTTASSSSTTATTAAPTTTTAPPTTTTTVPPTTTTTVPPTTTTTSLLEEVLGETTTTTSAPESSSTTATTAQPEATTSSTAGSSVLGSQLERPTQPLLPAPAVEGTDETQDVTIPTTGSNTGDYLLLAGLALTLGGLALRFGETGDAIPA